MATTIPGGVTSNVVGSTYHPVDIQDQAAAYDLQRQMKLDKEREWARAAAANANLGQPQRDPRAEADAKIKAAYEKIYGPTLQANWDREQGQIGGVSGGYGRISGDPSNPGSAVYKKYGSGLYGEHINAAVGQQPFEYRQDTNMPADMYQQQLDQAYEMWKAAKMLGWEDQPVRGTGGHGGGGGSTAAGSTWSGPAGMSPPQGYRGSTAS